MATELATRKKRKKDRTRKAGKGLAGVLASTKNPSERDEKIKTVLTNKFGPDAYEIYAEISESRAALAQQGLLFHHTTGALLLKLQDTYKEKGVAAVAKCLDMATSTAHAAMAFASAYEDEDSVRDLVAAVNSRGESLTWSHVRVLMIAQEDQRDGLLRTTLEKDLTSEQLRQMIQTDFGGKRSSGGRPPAMPSSFTSTVTAFQKMQQKWRNYRKQVFRKTVLEDIIRKTPIEKLGNPTFRKELTQLKTDLEVVGKEASSVIGELEDLEKYIDTAVGKVVSPHPEEAATKATNGKAASKATRAERLKKKAKIAKRNLTPAKG